MVNQSSMFNQSNMGFYEGFTTPTQEPSTNDQNSLDKLKQKELQSKQNASTTATISSATTTTAKNTPSSGIEGFNTVDREGVMLRGKRSSEMPLLSNVRNQSDNVEPTDTSIFTNTYSSF
jgi:hypothetical protein